MKRTTQWATLGLLATFAATALAPAAVLADGASRQKNKNDWRNLAIAGAAVAGYGLLKHNSTAAVLGAAGAAYSANRYEQDRRSQSQANRNRSWYYRSNGYGGYNGYNNGYNGYNNNQAYRQRRNNNWNNGNRNRDSEDNNDNFRNHRDEQNNRNDRGNNDNQD